MKRIFLLIGTIALSFLSLITNISALENNKSYNYLNSKVSGAELEKTLCRSKEGKVIFPNSINIGNKNIELYCVYLDKEEVLKEINTKFFDTIQFIKQNYNIEDNLNNNNWEKYRDAIRNISIEFPNVDSGILYDIAEINGDFDIYENDEINNEIINLGNKYNNINILKMYNRNNIEREIDELIPIYSDNFGTFNRIQSKVGRNLNVALATEYAKKYATNPNTTSYHYFLRGDCTNFISQILEYSGVAQDKYDSEFSGWWHKYVNREHKHSRSWTMADIFARYMGVTVRDTYIKTWADGLSQGDIVALDYTNDGAWDHMGYVTEVSATRKVPIEDATICFLINDIKIAQHTTNYHDWISSSKNGWETYYLKGAYGRIRG